LHFDEAVQRGAKTFGCEPYLSEERYRSELGRGRIRFDGLRRVLEHDLRDRAGEPIAGLIPRVDLRLAMLQYPLWSGPRDELDYFIAQSNALHTLRDDVSAASRGRILAETRRWVMRDLRGRTGAMVPTWASEVIDEFDAAKIEKWTDATWQAVAVESLWRVCCDGVAAVLSQQEAPLPAVRLRDALLRATHCDCDLWVNDLLVRYCAAFLDQGVSPWPLPQKEQGFYRCFLRLYGHRAGPPDGWLQRLHDEAQRLLRTTPDPLSSVHDSLRQLGVAESQWEQYLAETLLSLRGWAGMIRQVETRGERVAYPIPEGSLDEYLAVRLLLDRLAIEYAARQELGYRGPLSELPQVLQSRLSEGASVPLVERAFPIFQLAQIHGWSPEELHRLTIGQWTELVNELTAFSEIERRRVFHLAYERRFYTHALDALALHLPQQLNSAQRPRVQVITCLDEREESFRRHLEELAPECETFGAAGFFGVAMYFHGVADAHYTPLCPIVMTPEHWVEERACDDQHERHLWQARTRRAWGTASHQFRRGTHSATVGAVLSAGVGVFASVPLVARILFPRLAARVSRWLGRSVFVPPATQLHLERTEPQPGPFDGHVGYTVAEMATVSERLLRDIGLIANFARLVFILGHGSDSLNNPHKSAYDCGACGGSPGAPNGRALAKMLNDSRVRRLLSQNGIEIPADTWFVGGYHNTCNDTVVLADVVSIPLSHSADLHWAEADFLEVCQRNAHERCRRFVSAPLDLTPSEARRHVEDRSEDLAQVRPELGHATNALCVVGRRTRTRGLFMDRRAFLTSYDPGQDDAQGSTLERLLNAVVPVCGGISLEYYFSHVDCQGYGAGTKLPHNVTALLGVMDGAASDLRTGLPWQMVEIHEPVRLLIVVENTPQVMRSIMDRNAAISQSVRNDWVRLALLDPNSSQIQFFEDGDFRPYAPVASSLPSVDSSEKWYRGWRDHLEFAEIAAVNEVDHA
jgi:uncharacterized protein YbcC (UPF0753/DUF2309 family)